MVLTRSLYVVVPNAWRHKHTQDAISCYSSLLQERVLLVLLPFIARTLESITFRHSLHFIMRPTCHFLYYISRKSRKNLTISTLQKENDEENVGINKPISTRQ